MQKRLSEKQRSEGGFTLVEMLIVVAIIVILVAVSIPRFSGLLEKSREAADLANVRSAYSEVMVAALVQDTSDPLYDAALDRYAKTVELTQKKDGWDTNADTLTIGGIAHSDRIHWKGDAKRGGTCTVIYEVDRTEVTLQWSGYTVKTGYYWNFSGDTVTIAQGSSHSAWPTSAVPEPISVQTGQTIVVKQITQEDFPELYEWTAGEGGFQIGIATLDANGMELADTGGQWIFPDEERSFTIKVNGLAEGENVQLAIQFFKMKDKDRPGDGSVAMTQAEARELENIFTITD